MCGFDFIKDQTQNELIMIYFLRLCFKYDPNYIKFLIECPINEIIKLRHILKNYAFPMSDSIYILSEIGENIEKFRDVNIRDIIISRLKEDVYSKSNHNIFTRGIVTVEDSDNRFTFFKDGPNIFTYDFYNKYKLIYFPDYLFKIMNHDLYKSYANLTKDDRYITEIEMLDEIGINPQASL